MEFETIVYSVVDGVAVIRINREARGNSMSSRTYEELRSAARIAELDDDVDVIVFKGTGRFFATGGDLDEAIGYLNDRDALGLQRFFDVTPFEAIQASEKVTIAAVNGICMAGGLMLAKSCDICLAVDNAAFAIPEGRVGLADPWIPAFFKACANPSLARLLIFSGSQFSVETAMQVGIVGEVVAPADLETRTEAVIAEIRQTTVQARQRYKRFINAQREMISKEGLAQMYLQPDVHERLLSAWANRKRAS